MEEGDILCDLNYFKVVKKTPDYTIFTDINRNKDWALPTSQVNEALGHAWSANKVTTTQEVSRTELLKIFTEAGLRPFTVVFEKANGQERTLRGKLVGTVTLEGRSYVTDLEKVLTDGENNSLRQVDHRTIKSLILDGVKYNVRDN